MKLPFITLITTPPLESETSPSPPSRHDRQATTTYANIGPICREIALSARPRKTVLSCWASMNLSDLSRSCSCAYPCWIALSMDMAERWNSSCRCTIINSHRPISRRWTPKLQMSCSMLYRVSASIPCRRGRLYILFLYSLLQIA